MVCSICKQVGHRATTCSENPNRKPLTSIVNHLQGRRTPITLTEEQLEKMNTLIGVVKEVANGLKKGRSECVYQKAIGHELQHLGIHYTEEETMPILYKGLYVGQERLDIVLNSWLKIVMELKATTTDIKSEMIWQVVSYLRYKHYDLGLIVNFNQSPNKDINYSFVVLQDDVPYIYDPITGMGMSLTDYNYSTTDSNDDEDIPQQTVTETKERISSEVTPVKKIIKVKKPKTSNSVE
jgi:GxxExxY protein